MRILEEEEGMGLRMVQVDVFTDTCQDAWISLDFPALPPEPVTAPEALLQALHITPLSVGKNRSSYLVEVAAEATVESWSTGERGMGGTVVSCWSRNHAQ